MASLNCWHCGASLEAVPRPISRHEYCAGCHSALHCCRLCRHYKPSLNNACDEERADPPLYKEDANFCDWFHPVTGRYDGRGVAAEDDARAKLEALFGDDDSAEPEPSTPPAAPASEEERARAELERLFRKD